MQDGLFLPLSRRRSPLVPPIPTESGYCPAKIGPMLPACQLLPRLGPAGRTVIRGNPCRWWKGFWSAQTALWNLKSGGKKPDQLIRIFAAQEWYRAYPDRTGPFLPGTPLEKPNCGQETGPTPPIKRSTQRQGDVLACGRGPFWLAASVGSGDRGSGQVPRSRGLLLLPALANPFLPVELPDRKKRRPKPPPRRPSPSPPSKSSPGRTTTAPPPASGPTPMPDWFARLRQSVGQLGPVPPHRPARPTGWIVPGPAARRTPRRPQLGGAAASNHAADRHLGTGASAADRPVARLPVGADPGSTGRDLVGSNAALGMGHRACRRFFAGPTSDVTVRPAQPQAFAEAKCLANS